MTRIRVLVVEDSLSVRRRWCEVLAGDPSIEVAGEAADGRAAIAACRALRPDVITLDMVLPLMSGLAVTEYVMAHQPTPILIVSSSFNRGEMFRMYDALAAGAVDVLEKPTGLEPEGSWEARFLAAVKLVSRIRVITHVRGRLGSGPPGVVEAREADPGTAGARRTIVALGASTGGPGALSVVLQALPASFPLPVLLVLHLSAPFAAAFGDWLAAQIALPVEYARDGTRLDAAAGRVVMAPPDAHLVVRDGRLRLTHEPPRHSCRPSVDALFESLARERGAGVAACLLTGMGRDGAGGLLEVRHAGGLTIAQDEATSVVYGMPREAMLLGAAGLVLPLDRIGPRLATLAETDRGGARG